MGRLRIDLRSANSMRAGKWLLLARLGDYAVDIPVISRDMHTEWTPGTAGAVLGDGVPLMSVIDKPLELIVWSDEVAGRPLVSPLT